MSKHLTVIRKTAVLEARISNLSPGDFFIVDESAEAYTGVGNPTLKFSVGDLCYLARDPSKGETKIINLDEGYCTHSLANIRVTPVTVEATVQNRIHQ